MADSLATDQGNPLSGENAYSYTSTTSTLRPTTKQQSNALSSRRLSATSMAQNGSARGGAPIRPTPIPPRSNLVHSPTRTTPARPYSPPSQPTARYPSPPMRAQSVMTGVGRASPGAPHAQQARAELQSPKPEELAQFAQLCRELYYNKDAGAAQSVDAILNRLPAHSRTQYARTMAGIRSQFHRDEEVRRRQEVEATLAANEPGRKIMDVLRVSEGGTIAMRSSTAKQERAKLLRAFIQNHCVKAMPGTHPFFRSLYALLYLQALKAEKGGAGKRRVEWVVDMAVFSEASGGSWMADSIELLKGVLGCSEQIKESPPDSYFTEDDEDDIETDSPDSPPSASTALNAQSAQTIIGDESQSRPKRTPPKVPPHRSIGTNSSRERSMSDPFLDPGDRRTPVTSGPLSDPPSPGLPSPSAATPFLDSSSSPALPSASPPLPQRPSPVPRGSSHPSASPPPQFRIFTLPPYLTDPELRSLARLFPDFIASRAQPAMASVKVDEEAAVAASARLGSGPSPMQVEEGASGRLGHGEIRIGVSSRDEGWTGTLWERFISWLRGLFGG